MSFINHWPARSYVHSSFINSINLFFSSTLCVCTCICISRCQSVFISVAIVVFFYPVLRCFMKTSSNGSTSMSLALCEGMYRWPVDSPHKYQWRGALLFSMMCAWTNGWANNRDAGDLGCHIAHCDVTVMSSYCSNTFAICTCKDHSLEDLFQKFGGQYIWPMPIRIA